MHEEHIIPFLCVSEDVKLGKNVVLRPMVNLYFCTIGDNTKIGAYTEIGGSEVGARCKIGARVFIPPGIHIEDEVFVGPGVIFTNDKYPRATGEWKCLQTYVRTGASIGAGAIILPGLTIGEGAMIGAGAVVSRNVPPHATVVGSPAERIQWRMND